MPLFVAALLGGLVQLVGTIAGKVLVSLGMGFVVYQGIDTGLAWIAGQVAASFGSLATQTVAVLSGAGVGKSLAIVLSAISARLLLNGLTGGQIRKLMVK